VSADYFSAIVLARAEVAGCNLDTGYAKELPIYAFRMRFPYIP